MTSKNSLFQAPILLVSDDVRQRRTLGAMLREAGFTKIVAVASGERALASARRSKPGLVIVDACLAGMSCYEMAEGLDGVPVMLLSAEEGAGAEILASMVNAVAVVAWPASTEQLVKRALEVIAVDGRSKSAAAQSARRDSSYLRPHTWA